MSNVLIKDHEDEAVEVVTTIIKHARLAVPEHKDRDLGFYRNVANLIVENYPELSVDLLQDAISNGVMGKYTDAEYTAITSVTIFNWIDERLDEAMKTVRLAYLEKCRVDSIENIESNRGPITKLPSLK